MALLALWAIDVDASGMLPGRFQSVARIRDVRESSNSRSNNQDLKND